MEFQDKVVMITGAGSGLGRALAVNVACMGARTVLVGRRSDKLRETARQIEDNGGNCKTFTADVSVSMDVENLVQEVAVEFGGVDMLVNNAGIFPPKSAVYEMAVSDWDEAMAVNARGPFLMMRAVIPLMLDAGQGRIVNISAPLKHLPTAAAYCASKCALDSLTKAAAFELRGKNILINAVEPPLLDTEMHKGGKQPEEVLEPIIELLRAAADGPTGRIVKIE